MRRAEPGICIAFRLLTRPFPLPGHTAGFSPLLPVANVFESSSLIRFLGMIHNSFSLCRSRGRIRPWRGPDTPAATSAPSNTEAVSGGIRYSPPLRINRRIAANQKATRPITTQRSTSTRQFYLAPSAAIRGRRRLRTSGRRGEISFRRPLHFPRAADLHVHPLTRFAFFGSLRSWRTRPRITRMLAQRGRVVLRRSRRGVVPPSTPTTSQRSRRRELELLRGERWPFGRS